MEFVARGDKCERFTRQMLILTENFEEILFLLDLIDDAWDGVEFVPLLFLGCGVGGGPCLDGGVVSSRVAGVDVVLACIWGWAPFASGPRGRLGPS